MNALKLICTNSTIALRVRISLYQREDACQQHCCTKKIRCFGFCASSYESFLFRTENITLPLVQSKVDSMEIIAHYRMAFEIAFWRLFGGLLQQIVGTAPVCSFTNHRQEREKNEFTKSSDSTNLEGSNYLPTCTLYQQHTKEERSSWGRRLIGAGSRERFLKSKSTF